MQPIPIEEKPWGFNTGEFFSVEARHFFGIKPNQQMILTLQDVWDFVDHGVKVYNKKVKP